MSTTQLKPGQSLTTNSGLACAVQELLGSGGQGEVYRVTLGDQDLAPKWYFPESATPRQLDAPKLLVKNGPPSDRFLWPLDIVPGENNRFGYLMPVRERRFADGAQLMRRKVDPTFRVLATVGLELADAFLQLHSGGLCYCDVSLGNLFFDPKTGETLICDNDNVGINGVTVPAVQGTPRFMAPEIVRGQAMPDSRTDLFSLSVLLFHLFVVHHPLDGALEASIRCFDLPAMARLYGTNPVFIFDPNNTSNRPVKGLHDNALANWPLYPEFFQHLFIQAFTAGLHDRDNGRVRESEWRTALARLRDGIAYCGHCDAEVFYDPAPPGQPSKPAPGCWNCGKAVTLPPVLTVGRHNVMLNQDAQLYPHHIDDQRPYDFSKPVLAVYQPPQAPGRWGLKNLSDRPWQVILNDGRSATIDPGLAVPLQPGLRIDFGRSQGLVRGV